jgi:membrane protease YdiL (CAAX protease family)
MRARGLIVWIAVCGLFVVLELTGRVEGLAPVVPLILALAGARVLGEEAWARRGAAVFGGAAAGGAVVAAALTWRFGLEIAGLSTAQLVGLLLATAVLSALLAGERTRAAVLRLLGLDPASPVHAVTAVGVVLVLLASAALFVELQGEPPSSVPFYPTDSAVSLLTDLSMALAGVGFLVGRGPRSTLTRLDLRGFGLRQLPWAVLAAGSCHVVVTVLDWTERLMLPRLHALEDRFDYQFVGVPPVLGGLLLAVAAGVGEEVLFRGALQPRLGVVLTALVFAALHVQYQIPGILMIFVLGLALGLIKRQTSTTFTACVHVIYDLGAFLADFYG